jgi:hypothetical protein
MTRGLAGAVLALAAVGVAGADVTKDRDEFKAVVASELDGEWATDRFTEDTGLVITGANGGGPVLTLLFQGGRYTVKGWVTGSGTYAIRGAGAIDLYGEKERKTLQGIFRLQGDTLLLCYGKERPTGLEFKPGRWFLVLKRLKP